MTTALRLAPAYYRSPSERREHSRFALREAVRYRVLHKTAIGAFGSGQTLNMSSGGILFTTQEGLPPGWLVELSVDWPAKLDGRCLLKLVALGRVVRAEPRCAAIEIEKYEFRTRRCEPLPAAP
jgi:hypothetical protein